MLLRKESIVPSSRSRGSQSTSLFNLAHLRLRLSLAAICLLAASLLTSPAGAFAAAQPEQEAVTSAPRIVERIDESRLTMLKGNTRPEAIAKNDRGPVSSDLFLGDLFLILKRSPAQQAAFDQFVASQYDAHSPNFHHWLEPEEIGEKFGPSVADIDALTNWLRNHNLTVVELTKDHMSIRFSGTAAQVPEYLSYRDS